ncbi:MAG: EAL domain-containing protein [Rhodocyclales bacterium]|nr:EAL domain-containing protein [Rhodocyclales bacterium]
MTNAVVHPFGQLLRWLAVCLCCTLTSLAGADSTAGEASSAQPVRIGVLAFRGIDRARQDWQPHADYLSDKLSPLRFEVVPLTLQEFAPAIAARRIDLVVTNTGHYVALEVGGAISRIATMRIAGPQGPVDHFGGTAIARADRADMNSYADLRGKRLAVPDTEGFGGWQVHLREARAASINLDSDLAEVLELQAQDKVVASVIAGRVDAGFVRSDLIESMAAAGKLDSAQIKVLGERNTAGFPYRHSTRLYPHWPFAKLDHVPDDLTRGLLIALLSLPADHPAARAAGIYGWTLPQNYQTVHELFLEFRLGPYADLPVELGDVVSHYGRRLAMIGAGLISFLLVLLWWISRTNLELRRGRDHLQLAAGVFEHAQEGIVITDAGARIIDVNDTFVELTGYAREETLGQNPRFLSSGEHGAEFYRAMWSTLDQQGFWRGELINRRKDGSRYVQQTSISAVRDKHGRVRNYIGLSSDISALKESQDRLEQMAYFDALTGLPNRRLLSDRLNQAIGQAARSERLLAICYLDLDGFKPINDKWGHAAGDVLLIDASRRLVANVRAGDTVSRLGGDEFVVLLGNLAHFDECEVALERIRSSLNKPFQLKEGEAKLSASMGVTLFPLDGADPDMLLRHADQAMYQAKQAGRNRYALFDAEHDRISEMRRESLNSIERAIADNQLQLYYQPKVNMRSGEVLGLEALIRWQHPERGLLDPAEFLPMVDFVGLHRQVGEWVLETALRQTEEWRSEGHELTIGINVAAEQLQAEGFAEVLRNALARHPGVPAERIELEILETAALNDLDKVAAVMGNCQTLGVSFAIDDFGTGYSSLTYLKQLQARTLKIDQSFVNSMLNDPDDLSIVDSIIGLAASFRRQVIAEGVETIAHGTLLLRLGCDLAQGYGIARPMPAAEVPLWLERWTQPDAWRHVSLWPREDLPLLTVEIDHLRWIDQLRNSVTALPGKPSPTPPLDPHDCRFGHWLDSIGRDRYGHYPSFDKLVESHRAVHETGREIEQLIRRDRASASNGLGNLDQRRDTLLVALGALRDEVLSSAN